MYMNKNETNKYDRPSTNCLLKLLVNLKLNYRRNYCFEFILEN